LVFESVIEEVKFPFKDNRIYIEFNPYHIISQEYLIG